MAENTKVCPTCGAQTAMQKEFCDVHDMTYEPGTGCPACVAEKAAAKAAAKAEKTAAKEAAKAAATETKE